MPVKDAVLAALKEMILPELAVIKQDQAEIKTALALTNKRLDDVNAHLVDQSRRIDAVREELSADIKETNKRLDRLYEVIVRRDEHQQLNDRVLRLEQDMQELKRRLAA